MNIVIFIIVNYYIDTILYYTHHYIYKLYIKNVIDNK